MRYLQREEGDGLKFYGVPLTKWGKDLYHEISNDNIANGGAALSYYLLFSIFPAMIFFLSVLPYLPIDNLHQMVMDTLFQVMPAEAAKEFEGVIAEVTLNSNGKLLSFGAVLTLWAASAGLYAIMQQLNITYDVKESRPFWKARGLSILLTIFFGVMVISSFALIVFGGALQEWLGANLGLGSVFSLFFTLFKWAVIATLLLGAFAVVYYFGPDVEQEFRFITPGAIVGSVVFVLASLAFRYYVGKFGNYAATYGSLGAVIILMLWLYITGIVILLGSEINALQEHYDPEGKDKGMKRKDAPKNCLGHKPAWWTADDDAPLPSPQS